MADYTFRTETTGVKPAFEHPYIPRRKGLRFGEDGGRIMHRQVNERDVGRWVLQWDSDSSYEGEIERVRLAWAATVGGVLPMNYTPVGDIDANAVEVCFVADSLVIERTGPRTWTMEVEIEEAHD